MTKRMLIDAIHPEETRVVVLDDSRIIDYDFISSAKQQIKGNIYLAKITRVEPSLQAAFVEYGGGKQGFLPFAEIHPDYYQIPISDRIKLMEEAALSSEDDDAEDAHYDATEVPAEAFPANEDDSAGEQPTAPDFVSDRPDTELHTPSFLNLDEPQVHSNDTSEQLLTTDLPASLLGTPSPVTEFEPQDTLHAQDAVPLQATPFIVTSEPLPEGEQTDQPAPRDNVTELHPSADESSDEEKPHHAEDVETLAEDEAIVRRAKKPNYSRRYKIQEVIKRNQIVLVQVIKEERGNKGVSLTTYISLAGRYCVLMPNSPKDGGISRKIANSEDRRRLKQMAAELKVSEGMSAIIRTAGMDRTHAEIKRDYDYLVNLWANIREQVISSTAPAMVYEEGDLIKRSIRDLYNSDIEEVLVQGEDAFHNAKEFMKLIIPSHAPRVKLNKDSVPLFHTYEVEEQLISMHDPVVRLRSGGYIVMNPTEALISIDVNSGRATGERNIEETASKTNLEAAHEIARQLRLRDLAGLIVIDFIDMGDSRNRRQVERALKDALKSDRAKIQIGRISPFGLLEMSRQRLHPSVSEVHNVACPHCQGKGVVRSNESISVQLIRALEKEASLGNCVELRIVTSSSVATYLFNQKREKLQAIEQKYAVRITLLLDESQQVNGFRLEKQRQLGGDFVSEDKSSSNRRKRGRDRDRDRTREPRENSPRDSVETTAVADTDISTPDDFGNEVEEVSADGVSADDRPRTRRRRRRGGRDRNREDRPDRFRDGNSPQESSDAASESDSQDAEFAPDDAAAQEGGIPSEDRPRRRRNRGGRRRFREGRERPDGQLDSAPRPEYSSGEAREPSHANGGSRQSFAPSTPFIPTATQSDNARPPREMASAGAMQSSSSLSGQDDNKSSKKGWWRRIVE